MLLSAMNEGRSAERFPEVSPLSDTFGSHAEEPSSPEAFIDSSFSCRFLQSVERYDTQFASPTVCAVVSMGDCEARIRSDRCIAFDGYMAAGTVCFLASTTFVSIDADGTLPLLVLSVAATDLESRGAMCSAGAHSKGNKFQDFNLRSADIFAICGPPRLKDVALTKARTMELIEQISDLRSTGPLPQKLPRWRLRKVKEYVAMNISGRNCLPELAEVAGLSRMHFAAQFKAATCMSPHEFVLRERTKAASAMLTKSSTPIIEIALNVGFQNQAHFSTVFKSILGITPANYRRLSADSDPARHGPHAVPAGQCAAGARDRDILSRVLCEALDLRV